MPNWLKTDLENITFSVEQGRVTQNQLLEALNTVCTKAGCQ